MASLLLANPAPRRRRRKTARKSVAKRRSPRRALSSVSKRVVTRRYRRNPIRARAIMGQVQSAAMGAVGALAVDVAMSKLPLPVAMQSGMMRSAAQGLVSVGLGMIVSKVLKNRRLGEQIADGGLTVAIYNAGKSALADKIPGLAGDGLLGDDLLGYGGGVGWYSPAPTSNAVPNMDGYDPSYGNTDMTGGGYF